MFKKDKGDSNIEEVIMIALVVVAIGLLFIAQPMVNDMVDTLLNIETNQTQETDF